MKTYNGNLNNQPIGEEQTETLPYISSKTECSMCGRVGGVFDGCELCHGNVNYDQPRHYTLAEIDRGIGNPDEDRYDQFGSNVKVLDLPGSYNPYRKPDNKNNTSEG